MLRSLTLQAKRSHPPIAAPSGVAFFCSAFGARSLRSLAFSLPKVARVLSPLRSLGGAPSHDSASRAMLGACPRAPLRYVRPLLVLRWVLSVTSAFGARALRALARARSARVLAVWSRCLRHIAQASLRHVSTPPPPHRMRMVSPAPPPSLRIFRSRPQAVLELHVLRSGGSVFRYWLSVTSAWPPRAGAPAFPSALHFAHRPLRRGGTPRVFRCWLVVRFARK